MVKNLRHGFLCALSLLSVGQAHSDGSAVSVKHGGSLSEDKTSSRPYSTCRSGTVNYITHTLPQQCMTSSPTGISLPLTVKAQSVSSTIVPTQAQETLSTGGSDTTRPESHQQTASSSRDAKESEASQVTSTGSAIPESRASETPTTSVEEKETAIVSGADIETDSPLDNANFLSFEEWKKQNLVNSGQSPDHIGQQRSSGDSHGRVRPGINNALDVLGEDSEIELDFSGFGSASNPEDGKADGRKDGDGTPSQIGKASIERTNTGATMRSKDAGKTCKERTNYASFDCAATVVKSNPEGRSASSVLIENKDSYMLNTCSIDNKFFIVELCDDILIDTVVLANYEFFSSIFRTFKLSVSDRYPVKADRWRELGVFEARNSRNMQAFLVENPLIWARYLRIEFLTHYGNEYYCPVSLLRVHGTTMMEEFRHQEEIARGDDQEEIIEEALSRASLPCEQEPLQASVEADKSTLETSSDVQHVLPTVTQNSMAEHATATADAEISRNDLNLWNMFARRAELNLSNVCTPTAEPEDKAETTSSLDIPVSTVSSQVPRIPHSKDGSFNITSSSSAGETSVSVKTASTSLQKTSTTTSSSQSPSIESAISASQPNGLTNSSATTLVQQPPSSAASATNSTSVLAESSKHGTATAHASHAVPTTQESFFKSIHKRLQMLESNSTLSLQYIEEQSRILRDAFSKVEKRQVRKTETFLESLNTTVLAELQGFRTQYDQSWQSTIIELENHREQYQMEILAVSARLTLVADELLFQKRMVIVQSTLLIMCLGLVLFARAGSNTLELPIIQQMVSKSLSGRRSSFYSPPGSPSPDQVTPPRGARVRSSLWRRATEGNDTDDVSVDERQQSHDGPELHFEPPTPTHTSAGESKGVEDEKLVYEMEGKDEDKEEEVQLQVKETQSSPVTPTGTRSDPMNLHEHVGEWPREGNSLSTI